MPQSPSEVVAGLRRQALTISPAEISVRDPGARVWAVLMEERYEPHVATLVTVADGTTSLYFSNGGGMIGAGQHEAVRQAAAAMLAAAEGVAGSFTPDTVFAGPATGSVRFFIRRGAGAAVVDAPQTSLRSGRDPLSPLYMAGHKVIAAIRESSPKP